MNVSIPIAIVEGTNLLFGYKNAVITFFTPSSLRRKRKNSGFQGLEKDKFRGHTLKFGNALVQIFMIFWMHPFMLFVDSTSTLCGRMYKRFLGWKRG
jgi:hypothetical protein